MRFWISTKEYRPHDGQQVSVLMDESRIRHIEQTSRIFNRKEKKWQYITIGFDLVDEHSLKTINAVYDKEHHCYFSVYDGSLLENVVAFTFDGLNSALAQRLKMKDVCPMPEELEAKLLYKKAEKQV